MAAPHPSPHLHRDHDSQRRLERYRERAGSIRRASPEPGQRMPAPSPTWMEGGGRPPPPAHPPRETSPRHGDRNEPQPRHDASPRQQHLEKLQHHMDAHHRLMQGGDDTPRDACGWEAERATLLEELGALREANQQLRRSYVETEQLREEHHRLKMRAAALERGGGAAGAHGDAAAGGDGAPLREELRRAEHAIAQLRHELQAAREAAAAAEQLKEQNHGLRQHLAKVEHEMDARAQNMQRWRADMEQEMIRAADSKIAAHRGAVDAELEGLRMRERKTRESLTALQHAMQHDDAHLHHPLLGGAPDAQDTLPAGARDEVDRLAASLLDALLGLQDDGDDTPLTSDALQRNLHTAVERCFSGILQRHAVEMRAVEAAHEASVRQLELEHRSQVLQLKQQEQPQGARGGDGEQLSELRRECAMARDDLEQERQRVAMVCIHMKGSLEARNKQFEAAVMKKANAMVADAKARSEEAVCELRRYTQPKEEMGTQTDAALAPESYLANVLSTAYRKENGLDSEALAEQARHDAAREFERDVMLKAQSLLHKYSGVARRERMERSRSRSISASCSSAVAPQPLPLHHEGTSDAHSSMRGLSTSATPQRDAMCMYP